LPLFVKNSRLARAQNRPQRCAKPGNDPLGPAYAGGFEATVNHSVFV